MNDPKILKDAGEYLMEIDKSLKMKHQGNEITIAKTESIEGNIDQDYKRSEEIL